MKHNFGIGICCLLHFLACQMGVHAMGHPNPELPVLVQEADAVCIGRITQVLDLGPTQVDLGHWNSVTNKPFPSNAMEAVAEVAVRTVLKGKITQKSITVSFYKNVHQGRDQTFFTELAAGETDLIFLKAAADGAHFSLYEPNSAGKSKIVLGDVKISPLPAAAPPLRAALLVLADVLVSGSKPVKMDCLDRIGSVSYLLYVRAGVYVDKTAIVDRSNLGEPLLVDGVSSSLEEFIRAKVLPAVLKLTTDKDTDLHDQAVLAAGNLQDVGVVPALAKIADKQYKPGIVGEAADIFSRYRNPNATRALVGVLGDTNPNVRSQAAEALRASADPIAIPFLLDHLDDPDPDVRYDIVAALYMATDTPLCPGPVIFQAKEDQYVSFCKKWGEEHQDKVALLRDQFLAPLPTKAVH